MTGRNQMVLNHKTCVEAIAEYINNERYGKDALTVTRVTFDYKGATVEVYGDRDLEDPISPKEEPIVEPEVEPS